MCKRCKNKCADHACDHDCSCNSSFVDRTNRKYLSDRRTRRPHVAGGDAVTSNATASDIRTR